MKTNGEDYKDYEVARADNAIFSKKFSSFLTIGRRHLLRKKMFANAVNVPDNLRNILN
jgi:hypothetical protein